MNLTGLHKGTGMPAGSLIDPVLLFFLALMAGTLVVIVPSNLSVGQPEPDVQAEGPRPTAPADAAALARAQKDLRQVSEEVSSSHRRLQALRFETSRLDSLLRSASDQSADRLPLQPTSEMVSLEELTRNKQEEVARLTVEFENTKPPVSGSSFSAPTIVGTNKAVVWFGVVKNRVLPYDGDYYTIVTTSLSGGERVEIGRPRKAGETEEELLRPGSVFLSRLTALNPAKQVAGFLVDKVSFPVFRRARELTRQHNIEVAWDPNDLGDDRIVFSARGASVVPQR